MIMQINLVLPTIANLWSGDLHHFNRPAASAAVTVLKEVPNTIIAANLDVVLATNTVPLSPPAPSPRRPCRSLP